MKISPLKFLKCKSAANDFDRLQRYGATVGCNVTLPDFKVAHEKFSFKIFIGYGER